MEILERYVCVLYDKSTSLSSVNELRKELFCKRIKTMEAIPNADKNVIHNKIPYRFHIVCSSMATTY